MPNWRNPNALLQYDLVALTELLHYVSHGQLGAAQAVALQQSARSTFATPYAAEASSYSLKLLAQAYQYIHIQ
jgi:hypothetical protein